MENNTGKRLVSIVMPAYNCAATLAASVESVLAQHYENWELLILDDGSRDETWPLMQKLAERDSRIRAVQNERNLGVGRTRNRGVGLAEGDWVAFLDSDDLWTPDKLEKQLALSEAHPETGLLYTGSGFIRADGTPMDYVLHVPETLDRRQLLKQNLISCSSVLARKALLERYPMPAGAALHEDFAVWLRILEQNGPARGVDEPLLIYRRSAQSKSGNKWKVARMNWNTYRAVGLNPIRAGYYMIWYTVNGVKKYSKLR